MHENSYPKIEDYGYIGDCHSAALVSRSGSIDWCCMPRIDSGSCFGRILDWKKGGFCQIRPTTPYEVSRRYRQRTLILETTFHTKEGRVRLIDFFPMREGGEHRPHRQIMRIIEGDAGTVDFEVRIVPRFDYGTLKPWIRPYRNRGFAALGGNDALLITADFDLKMAHRHELTGSIRVGEKQRYLLSISHRKPEEVDEERIDMPENGVLADRLEETLSWWKNWVSQEKSDIHYPDEVIRSAIIIKGLSCAPTGAIAAAATTSLPEAPGGSRNWDYRYSWIRDSYFMVRSMAEIGFVGEADGFRRFVERSAAGSASELQIMFGLGGERRIGEVVVDELEGYQGARPVRAGNDAYAQVQLDVYGELLDLSWHWHRRGHSPDADYWEFLVELVNHAVRLWERSDQGIWEMRGDPRHFVLSKAMCWAALDRGVRMAEEIGYRAPLAKWKSEKERIRKITEEKGYDKKRGVFVQAFGNHTMDAALLLLPAIGFVDYSDPRMIRTTDAVWSELGENGLLRRYPVGDEGMKGREGVFLACSFWLAECLAHQGRLEEAHRVFRRAAETCNDVGLYSEEYDTEEERLLGNYPQGLTHLSLIAAVTAINAAERKVQS